MDARETKAIQIRMPDHLIERWGELCDRKKTTMRKELESAIMRYLVLQPSRLGRPRIEGELKMKRWPINKTLFEELQYGRRFTCRSATDEALFVMEWWLEMNETGIGGTRS